MKRTVPILALALLLATSCATTATHEEENSPHDAALRLTLSELRPSPGRGERRMLSDYLPSLAGEAGDTPVYIFDGAEPGGTLFVCAGTHGNEIAGVVAAAVLAECAEVRKGRLIVLPRANRSAATYPDPDRPGPAFIGIATRAGERLFAFGARRTRPEDEGAPDPVQYLRPDSALAQDGREIRNLDRLYPGDPHGGLTARVAYGISSLIEAEKVDLAFDLHEADPTSKLAWIIVANPKNIDLAAMAVLGLEERGQRMSIDASPEEPRGFSHREWGDRTRAKCFLIETPNPAQVYPPQKGDPVKDPELPLGRRVAAQLLAIQEILAAYNDEAPEELGIELDTIPSPEEIQSEGLGAFLE